MHIVLLLIFLEMIIVLLMFRIPEHATDIFDSKNITGIDNRSKDSSVNYSNNANNVLQDSICLCWKYLAHCTKVKALLIF